MKTFLSTFYIFVLTSTFSQNKLPDCVLTKEKWEAEVGNDWPYKEDTLVLIDFATGKPIKSSHMIRWEIPIVFYPNGDLKSVGVGFSNKKRLYFIEHLNGNEYTSGEKRKSDGKILRSFTCSLENPGKKFIKYWNLTVAQLTKFCWPYGKEG